MTPEHAHIVIVGAGQAGLASAHAARRAGLVPVVLEASAEPTGSWPRYYESLALFSPARYSSLPERPLPGTPSAIRPAPSSAPTCATTPTGSGRTSAPL